MKWSQEAHQMTKKSAKSQVSQSVIGFSIGILVAILFSCGNPGTDREEKLVVIEPQYGYSSVFSESLAAVELGNKFGYIDKKGKMIIKPQFEIANRFSEGLAGVRLYGKWGFIKHPLIE